MNDDKTHALLQEEDKIQEIFQDDDKNSKLYTLDIRDNQTENNFKDNICNSPSKNEKTKESIFLEWSNINYSIKIETKAKSQVQPLQAEENENFSKTNEISSNNRIILNNIEGFAMPNELMVIMGPSGCGKTSLLNIIAQRQLPRGKIHNITRCVKANNIPMDQSNFGKICAYIMQDDILIECLTPRESLYFGAKLRLKTSDDGIKKRVDRLIHMFGLEKCSNSMIGGISSKGISGGERKRTSIAYELISNPPIVIIDEPTTGMDSFTSLVIVKYLKQLAISGKTIICTIHQPSSEVFQYIDRMMLLKDGNVMYQGKTHDSLKYFDRIKIPIPAFCNPFDFFLTVLSDIKYSTKELSENYNTLCADEVTDERVKNHEKFKNQEIKTITENRRQVGWCYEFWLILSRTFINYVRNKSLFYVRVLNCLFNSLIIMGFYWDIGSDEKHDQLVQNYFGFFFNNVNQFFLNGMYCSIFMIPEIKIVLKREVSAKLYRVTSFYCALALSLLINSLTYAIIFTPMGYLTLGFIFDTFALNLLHFTYFFLLNFFIFTIGQVVGLFIGCCFEETLHFIISPFLFLIFMLGSGFYRNNSTLPSYISWLLKISPYKYLIELSLRNFKSYNGITSMIPDQMNYVMGVEKCIPILFGTLITFFFLGMVGLKSYTVKF